MCAAVCRVEQRFSLLQRKGFRFADFSSNKVVREAMERVTCEHNEHAHPFDRSIESVAEIKANTSGPLETAHHRGPSGIPHPGLPRRIQET